MNPKLRLLISVLVGVALAALIAFGGNKAGPSLASTALGKPFGGSFAGLTDENGKTLGPDAFAGRNLLVFFGFTYCPSICPTELQKVSAVMKKLPPEVAAKITPVFVSLDPERDTPAALKTYTDMFHPAIVGLTGTPEQLSKTKAEWKVYSKKVKTEEMTEYTIDHSSFLYLRGANGNLLGLFQSRDTPKTVLESINAALTNP